MGKTFKKREKDRFARKKRVFEKKKANESSDNEDYKKQNRGSKKDKYF